MSIIQGIRDKAAWIIIGAIALALIAFIVQDGFRSQSLFGRNNTTLGKVKGTKIDFIEFETRMKKLEEVYAQRGITLDEQTREGEQDRLWNEYVERAVMDPEYDKLGLEVNDKEVGDILYGNNPPQDLRQQFTDPKTGVYQATEAFNQIQQIRKQKNSDGYKSFFGEYIPALINFRKREKFLAMMRNSVYVPKWLVEKTTTENSQIASISYAFVPYSSVSDSMVKVTDADIQDYIDKHKGAFKQEKARGIDYVAFDAAPSKADSQAIWNQFLVLKDTFAKTTDIKNFVQNEGTTGYDDRYIQRKEIKIANIDSIIKTPVGGVFGPYLDGSSYALARIVDVKSIPDTVKVRHILIATQQQNPQNGQWTPVREDSVAKKLADSIALAIRNGSNFDSLVVKFSDDPGSKTKGGVYDKVVSGGMVSTFNNFIFTKGVGEKGIVKTEFGYHYIEILSQKGSAPGYQIAYVFRQIVPSDETTSAAQGLAMQFVAESRSKKQFESNAKKRNLNIFNAADVKPLDASILGLNGNARDIVRWMYRDASVGDVADRAFQVGDKYIVPVLTQAYDEGTMSVARARPQIEARVLNNKKGEILSKKLTSVASLDGIGKALNMNVEVHHADSILFSGRLVPNVGQELKVIGAAFNPNNQSKMSSPIFGEMGLFLLRTEKVGAVPNPAMDIRQQQNMLAENSKMGQNGVVQVMLQAANLKDYRYKFF